MKIKIDMCKEVVDELNKILKYNPSDLEIDDFCKILLMNKFNDLQIIPFMERPDYKEFFKKICDKEGIWHPDHKVDWSKL